MNFNHPPAGNKNMSTPFGAAIGTPTVSMSYPQQSPAMNYPSSHDPSFNAMPHYQQAPMSHQSYPLQQQPSAPSAPPAMPQYQTTIPASYPQQQQATFYPPAYPANPHNHHNHHHHHNHHSQPQQVFSGVYSPQIPQGYSTCPPVSGLHNAYHPDYHNQHHCHPSAGLTYKQQKKLLKKQKKQYKKQFGHSSSSSSDSD